MKITQATDFPAGETISIRIDSDTPQLWTLRLRIPGWLKQPARITVNGAASAPGQPGSFAALRRRWKGGDVVGLRLPQEFRGEPIDDLNPDVVAIMRGPLMLVAIDPPDGIGKKAAAHTRGFPRAWAPRRRVDKKRWRPTGYFFAFLSGTKRAIHDLLHAHLTRGMGRAIR